jgi:hypothetical protein
MGAEAVSEEKCRPLRHSPQETDSAHLAQPSARCSHSLPPPSGKHVSVSPSPPTIRDHPAQRASRGRNPATDALIPSPPCTLPLARALPDSRPHLSSESLLALRASASSRLPTSYGGMAQAVVPLRPVRWLPLHYELLLFAFANGYAARCTPNPSHQSRREFPCLSAISRA